MSSKVIISDEMLARAFIEASKDFNIETNLQNKGIFIPQEFSQSLPMVDLKDISANESHLNFLAQYNAPTSDLRSRFKSAMDDAEIKLSELRKWFLNEFRNADNKIQKLAEEIHSAAEKFGVSAEEFLKRMQIYIYKWVLRNSVVDSFEVGTSKDAINFVPSKVSTKGTFQFGRVTSDLSKVAGIAEALALIPTISVEVDVEYDNSTLIKNSNSGK